MILVKRPIKFRGKDLKTGKIVYGDFARVCDEFCIKVLRGPDVREFVFVDPDSVAQFVGYDKDGNELYEGDPVRDENGEGWVSMLGRAGLQFKEIGATFDSQTLAKDRDVLFVRK